MEVEAEDEDGEDNSSTMIKNLPSIPLMDIVNRKQKTGVVTIHQDKMVFDAIHVMNMHQVGALMVLDDDAKLTGIISERDYLTKVALRGLQSHNTPIQAIMSTDLIKVTPSESLADCLALMTRHRIRHLPIVAPNDPYRLIGVVSIGDLVKSLIDSMNDNVNHLQHYVEGNYSYTNDTVMRMRNRRSPSYC